MKSPPKMFKIFHWRRNHVHAWTCERKKKNVFFSVVLFEIERLQTMHTICWLTFTWGYQPVSPYSSRSYPYSLPREQSSRLPSPRKFPKHVRSQRASSSSACSQRSPGPWAPPLSLAPRSQTDESIKHTNGASCVAGGCWPSWLHRPRRDLMSRTMWRHIPGRGYYQAVPWKVRGEKRVCTSCRFFFYVPTSTVLVQLEMNQGSPTWCSCRPWVLPGARGPIPKIAHQCWDSSNIVEVIIWKCEPWQIFLITCGQVIFICFIIIVWNR